MADTTTKALNITPDRRRALVAIGSGEVVREYFYEKYHPYDDGHAIYRGRGVLPARLEDVLRKLLLAGLVVLPKGRQPTDAGGSMRRYQLTDAGRSTIETGAGDET